MSERKNSSNAVVLAVAVFVGVLMAAAVVGGAAYGYGEYKERDRDAVERAAFDRLVSDARERASDIGDVSVWEDAFKRGTLPASDVLASASLAAHFDRMLEASAWSSFALRTEVLKARAEFEERRTGSDSEDMPLFVELTEPLLICEENELLNS